MVNSTSTLILGSYLDGLFAALGSTVLIVLFGEIIPQAICSRYGLAVGTYTRFITYAFMCLTYPLSYPLSKLLDRILGEQIASTYTREKVRHLTSQANGLEEKEKKLQKIKEQNDEAEQIMKQAQLEYAQFMQNLSATNDKAKKESLRRE